MLQGRPAAASHPRQREEGPRGCNFHLGWGCGVGLGRWVWVADLQPCSLTSTPSHVRKMTAAEGPVPVTLQ